MAATATIARDKTKGTKDGKAAKAASKRATAQPTAIAPTTAPGRKKRNAAATVLGDEMIAGMSAFNDAIEPRPAPPATLATRPAKKLADELKLIAEASRLRVVWLLRASGETNVGDMCRAFGSSQPTISHSLSILRHAGVVESRRDGKKNVYDLTQKGKILARIIDELHSAE